jgi:hypothetical protein
MFARVSRYSHLPEEVTVDAAGHSLQSKAIRLLTPLSGTFRHTIGAADRLDQLAFRYYRQSRKWWRICDANPDFLSPLALLGHEPIVTVFFRLAPPDNNAPLPWAALRQEVMSLTGVEQVEIVEEVAVTQERPGAGSAEVIVARDTFQRAVLITYNELVLGLTALAAAIKAAGFTASEPMRHGRVGKSIVIPPDSIR